jgi:hypothetical protein
MAGSATFEPYALPLDGSAATVVVALFDRTAAGDSAYTPLPNVRCERVSRREGAVPSAAQFSYELDSADPAEDAPRQFEELWTLDARGPGVVQLGQELVVFLLGDEGDKEFLFHGFADAPQVDLTGAAQAVTFTASGVEVRCWDKPVGGAIIRRSTDPEGGELVQTDLVARCNPSDGTGLHPNCTPDGFDVGEGEDGAFPAFLDWRLASWLDPEGDEVDPRGLWTLGKLARYLLGTRDQAELAYVGPPAPGFFGDVDQDLSALAPAGDGTGTIDVYDESTYELRPVILRDVVLTGRHWPEVLAEELDRHGFALRFDLATGDDGRPATTPVLYRKDGLASPAPKDLMLDLAGSDLDPGRNNVGGLRLVRDGRDAFNQVRVASKPSRYEVSVVLAPGFSVSAADAADALALAQFDRSNLAHASDSTRAKYRVFVADEVGAGHWVLGLAAWNFVPLDLSAVLGTPTLAPPGSKVSGRKYVERWRPGSDELLTRDEDGRPLRAELAISTDYAGSYPALWDGTGSWQSLGHSGWRLLRDRLGIEVTAENPNGWTIPKTIVGGAPFGEGVVKVVESLAAPSLANPRFWLRLTTVIEGDHDLGTLAPWRRTSSPSPFLVERLIEARDSYRKDVVHKSSIYSGGATEPVRDDTDDALALAEATRAAHEFPRVAGGVTIPFASRAYAVGDRVRKVAGREAELATNAGAGGGETPQYPTVVALDWDFSGGRQQTVLQLADRRAEPLAGPDPEETPQRWR